MGTCCTRVRHVPASFPGVPWKDTAIITLFTPRACTSSDVPFPLLATDAQEFTLTAADDVPVRGAWWDPAPGTTPRGILQVVHGMSEHLGRYTPLIDAARAQGWAVIGHDHRGHGRTAGSVERLGHLADADGWDAAVGDVVAVTRRARATAPGLPVVLLGHSFGSFVVRDVAIRFGSEIDALVVMGTSGAPTPLQRVGYYLTALSSAFFGPSHAAHIIDRINSVGYNDGIDPLRTNRDWLSRNPDVPDAFLADPWCGAVPSSGFMHDITVGLRRINDPELIALVPDELPVLLISGEADPVGERGAGPREVLAQYLAAGVRDVTLTLYPEGRHEPLNDVHSACVRGDVLGWAQRAVG